MKIDTMRRIDRLAGVPLCWLATVLLGAWRRVRRRPVRPVRRVLFIELSEMGSAVLADPAMRRARARLGAELHFAIFEANAASLDLLDTVPRANIFRIRDDTLGHLVVDSVRFWRWARRRGIDTVIDLEAFSRYTSLLGGLSGADRRVGFHRFAHPGLYCGELLTHRVAYNPHIHIARNFIALVDALLEPETTLPHTKTAIADADVVLERSAAAPDVRAAMLERVRGVLSDFDPARHRLVLVNPNASEFLPQRRWMPDRFASLIRRILAADDGARVLITGAPAEAREAAAMAADIGETRSASRRANGGCRAARALRPGGDHGDQRFRAGAFRRRGSVADRGAVRTRDAPALSPARSGARDLRRLAVLAVRQRLQSAAHAVHRQRVHAGDLGRQRVRGDRRLAVAGAWRRRDRARRPGAALVSAAG
jgi:ADP-heptose:LPS heptosyltransferase